MESKLAYFWTVCSPFCCHGQQDVCTE